EAQVTVTALDAVTADDARTADGLVFLDGLADPSPDDDDGAAQPPALFPLLKAALPRESGPVRVLAAAIAGSSGSAGLAGLFRTIHQEYPQTPARYVELDDAGD